MRDLNATEIRLAKINKHWHDFTERFKIPEHALRAVKITIGYEGGKTVYRVAFRLGKRMPQYIYADRDPLLDYRYYDIDRLEEWFNNAELYGFTRKK